MIKMIEICFSPYLIEIQSVDYDQEYIDRDCWGYGGDSEHWFYCSNMSDAKAALKAKIEEQMAHLNKASENYGIDVVDMAPAGNSGITLRSMADAPQDGTHIILYGKHEDDAGGMSLGFSEGYMNGIYGWYHINHLPSYPVAWFPKPEIEDSDDV